MSKPLPLVSKPLKPLAVACALFVGTAAIPAVAAEPAPRSYQIASQSLSSALKEFAAQSDMQVIFSESEVRQMEAPQLSGNYSPSDALQKILEGTPLEFELTAGDVIVVRKPSPRISEMPASATGGPDEGYGAMLEDEIPSIPEIVVYGSTSLNVDIQRTEDDIQPYVVFDKEALDRSAASSLEDFLRTRLPMNKQRLSQSQLVRDSRGLDGEGGNTRSTFDLRGLGSKQTLILVDGRRMPTVSLGEGQTGQPDINGIPMASIERIEVLPSSASGIYGGSATGGVINIIRKRDYAGFDVAASFEGTEAGGGSKRQLDLGGSFFLGDRSSVTFSASHANTNPLLVGQRDFARKGRALRNRNVPFNEVEDTFLTPTVPLGATPNVQAAFDPFSGGIPDLVLDDGTPLGSSITFVPEGYNGGDGGHALVANAGQFNLELADDLKGLQRSLVNTAETSSANVTLRHEFSDRFNAYLDMTMYRNESRGAVSAIPNERLLLSDAPNNPFQQDINVTFPVDPAVASEYRSLSETLQGSLGTIMRLSDDWMLSANLDWSRARVTDTLSDAALDRDGLVSLEIGEPVDDRPALDVMQGAPLDFGPYLSSEALDAEVSGPNDTILKTGTLRLSGPLYELPGGALNLSALLERRMETMEASFFRSADVFRQTEDNPSGITYYYSPERELEVDSLYLEFNAPLIGERNSMRFARELSFQLSGRMDRQTTIGVAQEAIIERTPEPTVPEGPLPYAENSTRSTDLTAGFRFAPSEDVALRASFGTGYLPPDISQVGPYESVVPQGLGFGGVDPKRGGEFLGEFIAEHNDVTQVTGGNADLRPEESESLSFGVILTPRFVPGLRLSVDYTRIDKTDEIRSLSEFEVLQFEELLPGRVIRGPKLPGDPDDWEGPITYLNTSFHNFARTRAEAYDIQIDYTRNLGNYGTLRTYVVATLQEELTRRLTLEPDATPINYVGEGDGPVRLTGNMGLDWVASPQLTLSWNAQYTESHCLQLGCGQHRFQGAAEVPSQVYHDISLRYDFTLPRDSWEMLGNTTLDFKVENVFDQEPPILAYGLNYSSYGDPRMRRYSLTVRKSF
ncbi:TonB-dependent receptor [Microbulbifer sp.]|uniref:TonB-dependent receptor n=1 Tax=Microbulbifer sp. TaxID=1908541 RepID=UPI003F3612CD